MFNITVSINYGTQVIHFYRKIRSDSVYFVEIELIYVYLSSVFVQN